MKKKSYDAIRAIATIVPRPNTTEGYKAFLYLKNDFDDKTAFCGYLEVDKDMTTCKITAISDLFKNEYFNDAYPACAFTVRLNHAGKKHLFFTDDVRLVHKGTLTGNCWKNLECFEIFIDLTKPVIENTSLDNRDVLQEALSMPESDKAEDYSFFEMYRLSKKAQEDFCNVIKYLSETLNDPLN